MYGTFGTEIDQFGIDYDVEQNADMVTYIMGSMAYPGDFAELMDIAEEYVNRGIYQDVEGWRAGTGDHYIQFLR